MKFRLCGSLFTSLDLFRNVGHQETVGFLFCDEAMRTAMLSMDQIPDNPTNVVLEKQKNKERRLIARHH